MRELVGPLRKKKKANKMESLYVWFRGQGLGLEGPLKPPWARATVLIQEEIPHRC